MARDNREVEKTLLRKFAFSTANLKSADHRWLQLVLPGLPAILTKFSHTREDIGPVLWKVIAKQLRVSAHYLSGMIDCTNSREAYYVQIRTDPQPPFEYFMHGTASSRKPLDRPVHRSKHRKK